MVHVDVIGDGPRNVVLLHGCPSPPEHMGGLARALGETHRVCLVHHPGYGKAPAPGRPYSLADASEWIETALLDLGVREAAILGYSAGAYRALHLVVRRRIEWNAVIALAGFGRLPSEQREAYRRFSRQLVEGVDLTPVLVDLILTPDLRTSSKALVREVASWMRATSPQSLSFELRAYADGPNLIPMLREVRVPCLALVGDTDHTTPPARSREIAEAMPRGELEVLSGIGHAILLEDMPRTVAAVKSFLGRVLDESRRRWVS